eukprot:CAMPEP_0118632716 /NCGR_PEP_ID=MMETSP0785-20121206/598_1 /TAXON_ID=91992 /ORGANISM="Bolidomonas pacifica, Strain CCMP 1866" /LENGTH=117 /DNA_ID=CAMNT_0006523515 /DNA_START=115 /DNA_END=464 /DNA_ORIENTATION=-
MRVRMSLFSTIHNTEASDDAIQGGKMRLFKDNVFIEDVGSNMGGSDSTDKVGRWIPHPSGVSSLVWLTRFPLVYTYPAAPGVDPFVPVPTVSDVATIKTQLLTGDGVVDVAAPIGRG